MKFLLLLLFPLFLSATVTLEELKNSPSGHVRNFFIWQYMQTDISPKEASEAYCLVDGKSSKIFKLYVKKSNDKIAKEEYRCSRLQGKQLAEENNASCLNRGLSLAKAMKLTPAQRKKTARILKDEFASKSELILLMNKKSFISSALKSGAKNYLKLFNTMGYTNRHKYFNVNLSKEEINTLSQGKGFNTAVKFIVTDSAMHRMQKSLLQLHSPELSAQSYFFLALNSLKHKATRKATSYLDLARKKAYFRIDKDKALFWKYLIAKDEKLLIKLTKSTDINIYTLYANEKMGLEINNYFTEPQLQDTDSKVNLQDPYQWENILDEIRSADKRNLTLLQERYCSKEDKVLHSFIYSKAKRYQIHNYIMPYERATQKLSKDEKAIIYSLARQESHFIPSAISRSYALGVMQLMPFLVKALAKQKNESPSLTDMFNPNKNIEYAIKHLSYLKKHLYHPLFIAYAYNGGIGFTKRHLLSGRFSKGSFEPFLSMELMSNRESREYGKKVLANYVIYKKILGDEVKITSLFGTLTEPLQTDRFRTKALVLKR